jgi:hypothetical protein
MTETKTSLQPETQEQYCSTECFEMTPFVKIKANFGSEILCTVCEKYCKICDKVVSRSDCFSEPDNSYVGECKNHGCPYCHLQLPQGFGKRFCVNPECEYTCPVCHEIKKTVTMSQSNYFLFGNACEDCVACPICKEQMWDYFCSCPSLRK